MQIELNILEKDHKFIEELVSLLDKYDYTKNNNKVVHLLPVTERIKTFSDAYIWCETNAPELVDQYDSLYAAIAGKAEDILAFMELRIIAAALNEGWKPEPMGESWYPTFMQWNENDATRMKRNSNTKLVPYSENVYFAYAAPACTARITNRTTVLDVKSEELAEYFGKQFLAEWAAYCGAQ